MTQSGPLGRPTSAELLTYSAENIVGFFAGGGIESINTATLSGTLAARRLNAETGDWHQAQSVAAGAMLEFSSPFGGADGVLRLH